MGRRGREIGVIFIIISDELERKWYYPHVLYDSFDDR